MLSIDSTLWRVRSYNDAYAHITQRASGVVRTVMRSKLPSAESLAAMSERQFDGTLRSLFHDEIKRRRGIS